MQAPSTPERKAELEGLQTQLVELKAEQPTSATMAKAMSVSQDLKGREAQGDLESTGAQLNVPTIPGTGDLTFMLPSDALQPRPGAPLVELINSRQAWDWITNAIALAGIASV